MNEKRQTVMRGAAPAVAMALFALFALGAASESRAHNAPDHGKGATPVVREQKPWGIAGDASAVVRTVNVSMLDSMKFSPARIVAKQGETLRFVLNNTGRQMHEFVIGTRTGNDAHAALMMKFPDMAHDEPYMAHVAPGKTGQIIWQFNRAGDFEFACLIAGHYQSGMVGSISVVASSGAPR